MLVSEKGTPMQIRRTSAAAALLCVVSMGLAACAPAAPPAPRIGLYGDSIALQASPWFNDAVRAAGRTPMGTSFPGVAACDALDWVRQDLRGPTPPAAIAVSVVGNSLTNCMRLADGTLARPGTPEFMDLYRVAITLIADETLAAGVPLVLAWGPPTTELGNEEWNEQMPIRSIARDVAAAHPNMSVVDAGAAVAPPGGGYTMYLPCLPDETAARGCENGLIQTRVSEVNGHFSCRESEILLGWPRACPVYSSGARRYGEALGNAAVTALTQGRVGNE